MEVTQGCTSDGFNALNEMQKQIWDFYLKKEVLKYP